MRFPWFRSRTTTVSTTAAQREAMLREAYTAMAQTCRQAASGDLEVRMPRFPGLEDDPTLVEIRREFNGLLDRIDGFVRETHGALLAARDHRLYRAFLSRGMAGSYARAAVVVDEARAAMMDADREASRVQHARMQLADRYDATVGRVAEAMVTSAGQLSAAADGLAQSTSSAVSQADLARATVESLEERSKQIEGVVGVISAIAAQTKLLALNATIEAARAGESGKGFAVVADEVKQLAEQTGQSTQRIIDLVGAVQSVASESSTVMDQISGAIREMSELTTAVAQAVDGNGFGSEGMDSGLAAMTAHLRSESQQFVGAMRER